MVDFACLRSNFGWRLTSGDNDNRKVGEMSSVLEFLGAGGKGPLDSFWYRPVGQRTASGETVTQDVADTYSACWAATRLLSATGACLPLNLFRGTARDKEVATGHRVQRLLHLSPNGEMGSMMWRSTKIRQQVNAGNCFSEIERDGLERPVALWPIHHSRVTPVRAKEELARNLRVAEGSLAWEVKTKQGEEPVYLADKDMLHVSSMVSDNGIWGKGVIENARESIGFGIATEKQGAAFMKNSARPSVVIRGGNFRDADAREYYRRTFVEMHSAPENSGTPAMLPPGAELDQFSFSPEDSQFLQTREHNVNEIARWYGVPPHMIADLRRATFTNIEHQGIEFVVYHLIPWLKLWEESIQRKLLTPAEQSRYFVKHNVDGLLRGDSKARAEFYQALQGIGVLSVNEIRELEDRNPIGPDGDKRFVPLNFTTLDKAGMEDEQPDDSPLSISQPLDVGPPRVTYSIENIEAPDVSWTVSAEPNLEDHLQAARAVLSDTLERFIAKEKRAAASAASKPPAAFFAWLDEFYEKRSEMMAKAIEGPLRAVLVFQNKANDAEQMSADFAKSHVVASRELLLELSGTCSESQLAETIAHGVADWDNRTSEVEKWIG